MRKSDLPFGSEFSPSQIDRAKVLELANKHGGDWKAFEASVYHTYFESYESTGKNRRKLVNNTKLGMIAYGLIDRDAHFTEARTQVAQASREYRERLISHGPVPQDLNDRRAVAW